VGTVDVVVQVDNPSGISVNVAIARDDIASTATPGTDYNFANQNITTNQGGTTFDTVTITVYDDQLIEPTETVVLHFLNVSPNTNVIADSVFTLFITDNDTLTASFLGAGFSYVEGDTVVAIKVFLSTFPTAPLSVNVKLALGNAVAGSDFVFSDTVLVFHANSTDTQTAWINLIDDNIVEQNEQINFDLIESSGTRLGISAFTLTIIDNDSVVGIPAIDLDHSISIFPNPVMNLLTVETENNLQNVEITNLFGTVVLRVGRLATGSHSIDVSLLQTGMYFMTIRNEQKAFSKRFIKQD
jgi:hypothetical protein